MCPDDHLCSDFVAAYVISATLSKDIIHSNADTSVKHQICLANIADHRRIGTFQYLWEGYTAVNRGGSYFFNLSQREGTLFLIWVLGRVIQT